jgi:gliding motility-associated-like protein
MKKYLQGILLVLSLLITQVIMAQKLYWVGGSGNFNDAAHWSLQSGGVGGAKTPAATNDVCFDENSFTGTVIINFIGNTQVHDLIFTKYTPAVILQGLQNEKITINGDVQLNSYIDNRFAGDVWFNSNKPNTSVAFELTKFKGNIYFNGNTQWQINGDVATTTNATIYFKKGVFNLSNAAVYTDNLMVSPQVIINSNNTSFRITNKFTMPAGVIFNDVKSTIYMHTKDATKFQVDPSIHFNTNSRLHNYNSVSSLCNITIISSTQPTCAGANDGTIVFSIPAATCAGSDSIVAIWDNSHPGLNTIIPTAYFLPGNTPTTYSVSGLSSSSFQYSFSFANGVNQDSIYYASGISMADPIPPAIQTFPTPRKPSCFGKCDGLVIISIKPFAGTVPFTANWTLPNGSSFVQSNLLNNTNNRDTLFNACAGTYTVQLHDAHNCSSITYTVNLAQPALVTHTITPTNILCNGNCNGSITEILGGGTSPYTYTWTAAGGAVNSVSPTSTYSNLCAGTYTVRTTDTKGCKDSATATITQPPALTFTASPASGLLNIACNNACSGSLSITAVSGGTAPYTFSWTPAGGTVSSTATSSTYSNVCGTVAGTTYTCTITDANNCVKTKIFTVIAPPPLTHTLTATNPKCNIGSTGSATYTEGGGKPAYTFTWSPALGTLSGASPKSIDSNIPGGTYTVYATDANGCKDSASITLTPPPALTANMTTITNPTCPNLNNGQLCVTAGGGTSPFTYSWTPAAGTASCTPATLVSGNYVATVTDANSCTVTASASLVPPPTITVTAATTQPTCAGLSNGSATLTASGGSGPNTYTYSWSCSVSTASVIAGQAGGTTCNYTVTDGNNCKQTGSVTFNVLSPLTLGLTPTALSCAGGCNAQITSSVGGGIGGVPTYTWTGTGANGVCVSCANQTNMCAGSYTCNITDANGCTQTASTLIASPTPISITLTPTNPTCPLSCNGSIVSTISGGTGAPYTLSWSPALPPPNPANTPNPNSLCANTYTLNVTDANSCATSSMVTVTDPVPVTFTLTTTNVACAGQPTGTASVTASGGAPGYTYSWDGGGFGILTSQPNLLAGPHSVVVKDSKGCLAATQFFTITQPTALTVSIINVISTCNGLCNGGATANPSGGTPGYEYSWDAVGGPFSSGAISVNNLCVGNHTVYVRDTNNCTTQLNFLLSPLVNISISASSTSVSCHNLCDGTATASASNGFGNYTISWSGSNTCNNVPPSSPCTGVNLCGTVTVTATDANGCSNTSTLSIANPPAITATTNTTSVQCFGVCTGTGTLTPAGGTPAASAPFYNITWSPAVAGTTNLSNLCPGTYTATILDNNACSLTQTLTIGVSNQFTVTPTITPPSTCGLNDASISLAISGGSGTYTVNWMPGNITANPLTNIGAGTYTANINDANGCDTTIVYGVSNLTGPTTTVTVTNNVTCFGICDGAAIVSGSGNGAITVAWPVPNPTGPSPQSGTGLCGSAAGVTTLVNVSDAVGCVTIATVTITSPAIIRDSAIVVQPGCNGTLGSITLNPSGGNGAPYSYSWNGGAFTIGNNSLTNLSVGIDSCVIKDVAGCISQTYTYSINTPNTLILTVNTTSTTCSYSKNGTANASAGGGVPAYTYTWTNSANVVIAQGTNISNVSSLAPGVYTVSVTDASSCTIQTTFTINAPVVINPNFVKQDNLCNAGNTGAATVTPIGGTGGYTYVWNTTVPSPTTSAVSSVIPGNYFVIVYDANACSDTVNFTIAKPSSVTITVASTNPTCFGYTNGSATVTVTGGTPYTTVGTPAYTYSWSPISANGQTSVINLGVSNNPYSAIAIDSNNCMAVTSFTLGQPTAVSANPTVVTPKCVGDCNGSITAGPTGGTGSYSYTWTPAAPAVPSNSNLCAGNYTLVVTDGNNCKDTSAITIASPTPLSLIYSSTPATCNQIPCNGSIIINSANGNGAVTVTWVNPPTCANSYTCSALCAGIYSVKLTDTNLCTDTLPAIVSNSNGPVVSTASSNVDCFGSCNGTASVTVTSGSNPPYIFTWNSPPTIGSVANTATTSIASGLCDSSYISTVTDNMGCKTITTFSIGTAQQIQDNPSITSATCLGINNGTIISMGSGGTPFVSGYLYSIDGGPTFGPAVTYTFTNLSAGSHTICITDSVNCTHCSSNYFIPPNSAIISNIAATNINCFNNCNGTATVSNINGGAAPYTVSWNPSNQTGTFASNLCAGTYTATITDNVGCMALDTISIISPSAINPNTLVTNPTCGQCDGNITVTPTGGNGATYTYTWSPAGSTPTVTNVCAGPYQVNIADNLGCTQTFLIPVSSSNSPTITVSSTNVSCSGLCDGSATVTAVGGVTPYTYLWPSIPSSNSIVNSLCPNSYFAQVKDAAGCIATQSVSITAPTSFTITYTTTSPNCNLSDGAITTTVTGVSTYSYQWSANAGSGITPSVSNLPAGIYTLVVTDNTSGCTQTAIINLSNNSGATLVTAATDASCFGTCDGTATVAASFGTPPVYSYTWTTVPTQTTSIATGLCAQPYSVLVSDGSGCIQIAQVTVNQPTKLIASLPTVSPLKCNADCNGAINTVIFGGTPAYTYSWSTSSTNTNLSNLCAGNYSLTVTDAKNCTVIEFDTITAPTALVTTATVTPTTCNNSADGAISTITSGGTPTYTFQWSGGSNATTSSLAAILPGTYTLVATDSKSCTDTTNYIVTSGISLVVNAGRDTALCSNAPIVITGTVTGTATFNWQDITGTPIPPANTLTLSVNPVTTTQYVLMAVNGPCTDDDTITVTINPIAIANAGASQSIFTGQTATIGGNPSNPNGGTILWMPNIGLSDTATSNPIAAPAVTTTYTVFVTNASGCIASDTMMVIILPPIVINNGFTPNGDGKNDTWMLDELFKFPNVEVEIYNRWGEQLFYSKGTYNPWNGTYKGSPVPVGTYYYIIRLNDKNFPDHYAGPLTILR